MSGALAFDRAFLVPGASIAMMFGTIAVAWTGMTPIEPVLLFGAYVLSGGVPA